MKVGEYRGEHRDGLRILLLQSGTCRVCLALNHVVEVIEEAENAPAKSPFCPIIPWAKIAGENPDDLESPERTIVVVDTAAGPLALRVGACLGIRHISREATRAFSTRLVDRGGRPLCSLLLLDDYPHFLIEPAALEYAQSARSSASPSLGSASGEPRGAGL